MEPECPDEKSAADGPVPSLIPTAPSSFPKSNSDAISGESSIHLQSSFEPAKTWKPLGLRIHFLLPLACLSALLLAALVFLAMFSHKNNGLIHLDGPDKITNSQYFTYNYLPVIIAVLYSFLWQIVDSDARRFEPFVDLDSHEGIGINELFYDYAHRSALAVPFLALRKPFSALRGKHSGVAFASCAYLVSSIVFPSLASSVFAVESITLLEHLKINIWSIPTVPFANQSSILDGEYLTQASSILLQDAALPRFVTTKIQHFSI